MGKFVVFVEGKNMPQVKHETIEIATEEAKRLSKIENRKTIVLEELLEIVPVTNYEINKL